MFPFQQNSDEFWPQIFSNPYQEDIGKDFQDLIYGQDSLHGISNQTISVDEIQKHKILATSKANDHSGKIIRDEKKIARKEIERQRRQHISTLHASLRNLLPLESIKGKRSISDHMNEAAKYIKHLSSNIRELSAKRDKFKKLSNSSTFEQGTEISGHNLLDFVKVRPYLGGVEIVVSGGCGEEGFLRSRVLEALLEEGFDAVSYVSTQKDERHYTTIQCQATNRNCIDSDGLQRKLNVEEEPKISKKNSSREYPWEIYTLKEILHATNNFHDDNKIGEGGFGSVYWGQTSTGTEIAVKRLKAMSSKAEMEFAVEVEMLGRVRHKNLLGLRGFYAGGNERLIVYDYMPNHSLIAHLHGQVAEDCLLDWNRRMNIIIGSAEGIAYLHHEANPHIIHRDIKASNVLLDVEFQAKVADFGFAKLIPEGVSHLTTRVKGTLGYLAPEYAMWGKVSESCDVYSFGILLLEIISAKKPLEKLPGGVKRDIVQWATPYVQKGAFDHIADPRLKGRYDRAQLNLAIMIAMRCSDTNAENRPSMMKVVEWLNGGLGRTKEVSDVEDMVDEDEYEEEKL